MIKNTFLALSVFVVLAVMSFSARAADDFGGFGGAGFSNQGHPAFGDVMMNDDADLDAAAVAGIEPAAGDSSQEDAQAEKQSGAVQEELEKKFDTDVTHTVIDRGDGDTNTRDRVGEGEVGIFYDHNKDERLMDDDDSIGVEMKVLEFQ